VLSPFNLVIGPNGSGKTSLITSILRLRTLARISSGRAEESPRLADAPEINFRFSPPHSAITARLGCVAEVVCDSLQVSPPDAADWPALREAIAGIRSYRLDAEAMAEPSRPVEKGGLASNGGNLAGVMATLRDHERAAFAGLAGEVVRIMPEFAAIELVEREGGRVELALQLGEGGRVLASDLSQGTLYLLGVLVLAFDPKPPSIVCIEEIDREFIRVCCANCATRFIISATRNPSACIARQPKSSRRRIHRISWTSDRDHPEEIVLAHKQGSTARFERLADRADLADLLREGPLGDLWYSGVLGSVPEER
jgi:energy-coupling factor transporter ATP-binding protein EcfA2